MNNSIMNYISEGIGMALLMFFGCGTILFSYSSVGVVGVALTFAIVYVFCFYLICNKTGCHLNPVVSFAMLLDKEIEKKTFGFYLLAQLIGSVCGCLLITIICFLCKVSGSISDYIICNGFASCSQLHITIWGTIIIELICTFCFVLFFMASRKLKKINKFRGVFIALLFALLILFSFQCTGTCINPFRALAPALCLLIFGAVEPIIQFPVFLVVTFAGSYLAVFVYRILDKKDLLK